MALNTFDQVEAELGAEIKQIGKKMWAGVMKAAASGFGKGVLIAAAVVIAGFAVSWGFDSSLGQVTLHSVGNAIPDVTASTTEGVMTGISKALGEFFTSGAGIATLAVGGAVGAVADVKKEHGRISAQLAEAQARQYEHLRQPQGHAHHRPTHSTAAEYENPEAKCGHCAQEDKRRALAQANAQTMQDVQNGHGGARVI